MDTANLGCLPSSQPSFPVHLSIALLLQTVEEYLEHHPAKETRHTIKTCHLLKQCSPLEETAALAWVKVRVSKRGIIKK